VPVRVEVEIQIEGVHDSARAASKLAQFCLVS
jgi:hypothetical protein